MRAIKKGISKISITHIKNKSVKSVTFLKGHRHCAMINVCKNTYIPLYQKQNSHPRTLKKQEPKKVGPVAIFSWYFRAGV